MFLKAEKMSEKRPRDPGLILGQIIMALTAVTLVWATVDGFDLLGTHARAAQVERHVEPPQVAAAPLVAAQPGPRTN